MVLMHGETQRNLRFLAIKKLSFMAFLVAGSYASFATAWPILLKEIFHKSSTIGFVSASFSILGLICLISFVHLIQKIKPQKLYFTAMMGNSILFLLYTYTRNKYLFLSIAIINVIFMTTQIQCFGILLRDHSSLKTISKNETLMFLLGNVGWLLGPLISGLILAKYGINLVFVISSLFLLVGAYIFSFTKIIEHKSEEQKVPIWFNLLSFFKRKKLIKIYLLSGGLEVWWCLPFIFIPLELLKSGYQSHYIGILLFCVMVPLILVEGLMKKFGGNISEKRYLIGGYSILSLVSILCFFTNDILITSLLIIFGSLGVGLIESNAESIFFKSIRKIDGEKFYGPFTTAKTMGSFIGKLSIALCLSFFIFKYSFIFMFIIMFGLMIVATKIKK
jgi:MFS family permease